MGTSTKATPKATPKAAPKAASKPIEPAQKVDLTMSKAEIDQRVENFKAKQAERFQKRLETRTERYEAQLQDKGSTEFEIIVRKAKLDEVKNRMKELRVTATRLRGEIKEIKQGKSANRSVKRQKAS